MDWSSITRYRGEFTILVGFALLLNPFIVSAYDIGDPDWYRYERSEVEFYANGTYDYDTQALPLDPDVACFESLPSRSCVLERAVHANGGITYDGPPRSYITDYSYVHVWEEGFFEPGAEETENETVQYGLTPVPQNEALEYIATPLSRADPGVRTAIETGTYETSDRLPGAHELVRTGDRYYVVYPAAYHEEGGSERSLSVVVLQWVLGFTGAFLVLRGQRQRVERP